MPRCCKTGYCLIVTLLVIGCKLLVLARGKDINKVKKSYEIQILIPAATSGPVMMSGIHNNGIADNRKLHNNHLARQAIEASSIASSYSN